MHIPMEYKKKQYFRKFCQHISAIFMLKSEILSVKQGILQVFGLGKEFDWMESSERKDGQKSLVVGPSTGSGNSTNND